MRNVLSARLGAQMVSKSTVPVPSAIVSIDSGECVRGIADIVIVGAFSGLSSHERVSDRLIESLDKCLLPNRSLRILSSDCSNKAG